MRGVFLTKLDRVARYLTPFLLSVFLLVANHIPLFVPGLSRVVPILALIAVFHWGVYRPDLLPVYAVFFLGLLNDILEGSSIGVWTLIFLIVYKVAVMQRRFFFGKKFVWGWVGFSLLAAFAMGGAWLLNSLLLGKLIHFHAPLFQFLITVGFYGPIVFIFMYCQHTLLVWD